VVVAILIESTAPLGVESLEGPTGNSLGQGGSGEGQQSRYTVEWNMPGIRKNTGGCDLEGPINCTGVVQSPTCWAWRLIYCANL